MRFLQNLYNWIPSALGVLQSILPMIKEAVIVIIRIIAILPMLWSEAEPMIAKVNKVYDIVYKWVEKAKNFLLIIK